MSKLISFIFIVIVLTFASSAKAQVNTLPKFSVGVGCFGEMLAHPGVALFSEVASKKTQNQFLVRFNLIGYRHKGHTQNLYILPEFIFRRNTEKLAFVEASIGTGALYQKADTKVVEYNQGFFTEVKRGWFYFTPSFGLRYGRTLQLNKGKTIFPSAGLRLYYLTQFNDTNLMRAALDISVAYKIK